MDLVQLFISLVPLAIYHLYVLDRFKQHDGVIRSEALAIANQLTRLSNRVDVLDARVNTLIDHTESLDELTENPVPLSVRFSAFYGMIQSADVSDQQYFED